MRVKNSAIVAFVMLGAIFGYPLIAGLSTTFGLPNSMISLILRASVAILSLYLLITNTSICAKGGGRILFYCIAAFFLTYILRLTFATYLSEKMPLSVTINYWIWTLGSALLPALGISLARVYDFDWIELYRKAFFVTLAASLFVVLNVSTTVTNEIETYDSGRARLETLNPISLGHLGASLFLLSLAAFLQKEKFRRRHIFLIAAGVALGISLLVGSNSRGPIIATAAALFFAWLTLKGRRKLQLNLIITVLAIGFAPTLLWFEDQFGVTTYSRMLGQSFGSDINVVARLDLYALALQAFSENLLFGAGPDVAEVGFYPHNVTIEAFMSTGILGGVLFSAVQLLSVFLAWKICRAHKDRLWIGMIIIQYLVAAQFSGALYASPQFWAVIGISVFASSTIGSNVARTHDLAKRIQFGN